MCHDKHDLVPEVIASATGSTQIGDLVRMRLFSAMALARKPLLDPFTGSFVSAIPLTVTSLRLALHTLESAPDPEAYLAEGVSRLSACDPLVNGMGELLAGERSAWNDFFDRLDEIEDGLAVGDATAGRVAGAIQEVIRSAEAF